MAEALVQAPSRSQSIPQVVELAVCRFLYHSFKYNDFIYLNDQVMMCILIVGFGQNSKA